MRIVVAGAGAGKTTNMASHIGSCEIPPGKVVYCVAFTNAAADNIRAKLANLTGMVSESIRVSTIHSFLYSELIQPYYHLLFGSRYTGVSVIGLPIEPRFRAARIKDLDDQGLLHQTVIPQRAKWVVVKKTGDRKRTRDIRVKILAMFASYCQAIYIDEAQDIDKDMKAVLLALDAYGIEIELHGDPKQDVKGHGCFRELIDSCDDVSYSKECHRCPQVHLRLSNTLAREEEKQVAGENNREGRIGIIFETDIDVASFVSEQPFGLVYISRKNDRFETHSERQNANKLDTLRHEIWMGIREKHSDSFSGLEGKRMAYYIASRMIALVDEGSAPNDIVNHYIQANYFDFEKKRYARIMDALKDECPIDTSMVGVKSIEAIKGLEADKCLFVLTTDIAPYLVGDKKDDNKMKCLLYVALTRSLDELYILVTQEVEEMYSREKITTILDTSPAE